MASTKLNAVDLRIIHPLVCNPEDGLSHWPVDTLHRVSISLHFIASVMGGYSGEENPLGTDDQRFAFYLQLSGIADLIAAVKDALSEKKTTLHPDEVPVKLGEEEIAKLEILACRRRCSVATVAGSFIKEKLAGLRVETMQ